MPTLVSRPAILPDEEAFLFAWLDAPDGPAGPIYADWLEEHADQVRAAAVRQHLAWRAGTGPAMDPASLPVTWARTTGITAAHALVEHEAPEPQRLLDLARPALAVEELTVMPDLPVGQSRMGGHPDLPPGATWPLVADATGVWDGLEDLERSHAMMFVGQIRMEELAGLHAARGFPPTGLLSLFAYAEVEVVGTLAVHLRFTPDASVLQRIEPPVLHGVNRVAPERGLRLADTLELPMPQEKSPFFEQVPEDAVDALRAVNLQLGRPDGYGLLGHVRGTSNYFDVTPDPSYRKLGVFQVDPEEWIFAHLMIREEDLAAGAFDEAKLVWVDFG